MLQWLLLFSFLLLSACVSDSSNKDESQNHEKLYGSWRFDNKTTESFIHITKDNLNFFNYHKANYCHTTLQNHSVIINDNNISIESDKGQSNFFTWSIQGNNLILRDSDGVTNYLTRSFDNPESVVNCLDTVDQGIIDISISFQELPESIPSEDYFSINLIFDLNGNKVEDKKDISVTFIKFEDDETTNINDIRAHSRMLIEKVNQHFHRVSHLSNIDYSLKNNTINFQIKKSDHLEFSRINASSRIQVASTYGDGDGGNAYGADFYPDYNEFTPQGMDLSNLLDNSDDVYRPTPETIRLDIQEISIRFIDQPLLPFGH